ncbi:MAG: Methionine synthase vitamin-B12 independent, partial [uncultured bacterium]
KNPTCTGKLSRREPLAAGDLHFLRTITAKPVKITPLPGPYLLTRSMWVGPLTRKVYRKFNLQRRLDNLKTDHRPAQSLSFPFGKHKGFFAELAPNAMELPVNQFIYRIGHPPHLIPIVRNHQERVVFPQFHEELLDLRTCLAIQRRGGFIEKEDLGIRNKGPGDAQTLLLSAGKVAGIAVQAILDFIEQVHSPQHYFNFFRHLSFTPPALQDERKGNIFKHGHRQRIRCLKNHADPAPQIGNRKLRAVDIDCSIGETDHYPPTTLPPPFSSHNRLKTERNVDLPIPDGPVTAIILFSGRARSIARKVPRIPEPAGCC